MKMPFKRSALALLLAAPVMQAQSLPADTGSPSSAVGFSLPQVGGSLTYGISASELVTTDFYNSGTGYSTNLSGDLAYVSKSARHPFSAIYDGGILIGNRNQPTTPYQSLSFSQVLNTKQFNLTVADSVSYLPQSPVGGLSGVAGTGDLGLDPIAIGPTAGIGVLTNYGPRVSNSLSATLGRQLSGKVSIQATGLYSIQRFFGDNAYLALNNTGEGGSAGVSYHLSARNTVTGNYNYSHFSYPQNGFDFTAQGATFDYSRQWSRRLSTEAYAGPQIISGSGAYITGTDVNYTAGAAATYQGRAMLYSASFSRGAANGSGVIPGSFSNNLVGSLRRQFGRDWSVAGDAGYSRTTTLPNFTLYHFGGDSVYFSVQGSRRISKNFSGFASYTVEHQSTQGNVGAQNAFNGVFQVFSVGVTYSPRSILLGR